VSVRTFVTTAFSRWLRKSPLSERDLCDAIKEMTAGLVDADLGGHVFKKRVAVPGRGKRGGSRLMIGTNLDDRWFFLFGFEKNERANINDRELVALQKLASELLKLDVGALGRQLDARNLTEICRETKSHTQ
jgi:hypothetical protein